MGREHPQHKQVRVVVVSSERPLYVDAVAAYKDEYADYVTFAVIRINSKRDVPVKEINCALEVSRFGWACAVAATYPPAAVTPR